jgi:hypothetical protein
MDFAEDTCKMPVWNDEDSFERGVAFEDLNLQVRSRVFRGGRLTAVMGTVTVDLREAALGPEGATLSVQSAMSEIDILVPRDWHVVCDVGAVCGGTFSDRFPPPENERVPRLRLTGMVVAGAICVR